MDDPGIGAATPQPRRRWTISSIARVAALPALLGVLIGTGALKQFLPQDPYVRAAEEAGAEMLELPAFEERFGALDEDDAFRAGAELGASAIPRLPAAELGEWLTITRQLLRALDTATCANAVRGVGDSEESLDALKVLDIDTYRRYLEIVMVGVRLELTDASGTAPPSQADVDAALGLLTQEVGSSRMQEVGAVMANPSAASDSEVCQAALTLYDALATLDPRSREILLRMVTGPTA